MSNVMAKGRYPIPLRKSSALLSKKPSEYTMLIPFGDVQHQFVYGFRLSQTAPQRCFGFYRLVSSDAANGSQSKISVDMIPSSIPWSIIIFGIDDPLGIHYVEIHPCDPYCWIVGSNIWGCP